MPIGPSEILEGGADDVPQFKRWKSQKYHLDQVTLSEKARKKPTAVKPFSIQVTRKMRVKRI